MSDTRVPEIELVKFLSEILVRQPARHKLKPFEHSARGKPKRRANGDLVYAVYRMREVDYDHLCMLVNDVRREFGWPMETFRKDGE
jgi:hypothetical protein